MLSRTLVAQHVIRGGGDDGLEFPVEGEVAQAMLFRVQLPPIDQVAHQYLFSLLKLSHGFPREEESCLILRVAYHLD